MAFSKRDKDQSVSVFVIVVVLGIVSVVAGFAAEATKVKASQVILVYYGPECVYPRSPAAGLAIVAAMALVLVRVTIRLATGGVCSSCQIISNLPKLARVCIIISWIASILAVSQFLIGAKFCSRKGVHITYDGEYYCYVVKPGIFSGAAIVSLVSMLLTLFYYLSYVSAKKDTIEISTPEIELEAPSIIDDMKKPPMSPHKR